MHIDEDRFSAADCGVQPTRYDKMDMADQLQQKFNNIVCWPFPISYSLSRFSHKLPPHPAPPPSFPPSSSILLLQLLRSHKSPLHLFLFLQNMFVSGQTVEQSDAQLPESNLHSEL